MANAFIHLNQSLTQKNVTASARVTEFPGENFTISKSNGQLFSNACREEIGLKKTITENHVKSSKHASRKERLEKKEARERDIGKDERKKVKEEIEGRDASIIFDGTTHVAEAPNIILRFVIEWKVHQRLIQLLLVTKSMNGEELAHQLLSTLSVDFSISPSSLLAAARDRASVNNVAIRHLKILYPNLVDIGCFIHTLDHVGEKMATPNLEKFMKSWVSLVSHSAR